MYYLTYRNHDIECDDIEDLMSFLEKVGDGEGESKEAEVESGAIAASRRTLNPKMMNAALELLKKRSDKLTPLQKAASSLAYIIKETAKSPEGVSSEDICKRFGVDGYRFGSLVGVPIAAWARKKGMKSYELGSYFKRQVIKGKSYWSARDAAPTLLHLIVSDALGEA